MATEEELRRDARVTLMECVENRFPERQVYRDEILRELLAASIKCDSYFLAKLSFAWRDKQEALKQIADDEGVWARVDDLMEGLSYTVMRYPDDGKALGRWNFQPTNKLDHRQETDESASLQELSNCCRAYQQSWWANSPILEIWLMRQMIFAETYSLGRELGIPPSKKMLAWMWGKSLAKWLIGLGAAVAIGSAHGAAFGIFVYAVWLCLARYLANDKVTELTTRINLFSSMRACYVLALRSQPCPAELSDALSRAENVMAVWPDGLRSLVETQLQKNRARWV